MQIAIGMFPIIGAQHPARGLINGHRRPVFIKNGYRGAVGQLEMVWLCHESVSRRLVEVDLQIVRGSTGSNDVQASIPIQIGET